MCTFPLHNVTILISLNLDEFPQKNDFRAGV